MTASSSSLARVWRSAKMQRARGARSPEAIADAIASPSALFDEARLRALLAAADADVLVVDRGAHLSAAAPRTLDHARATLALGHSLVIRRAERSCVELAEWVAPLASGPHRSAHVQAFVTPTARQSFAWHYDLEDVIIVQTQGEKDYYLRENTVVAAASLGEMQLDAIARETAPLAVCRLVPGDVLYLPRGWWHVARGVRDAWSLSVGLTAEAAE